MARFREEYGISLRTAAGFSQITGPFMIAKGFQRVDDKGEMVWRKGVGFLVCPQFVTAAVSGDRVCIEAWIKYALLPGVYVGELGLTGVFQWVAKRALRKVVAELRSVLTEDGDSKVRALGQ